MISSRAGDGSLDHGAIMIVAFIHDERFTRDSSGAYYSSGTLPYRSFARYLRHFDRVVMVGRLGRASDSPMRTLASGEGVEFDCIPVAGTSLLGYLLAARRRVREVLARVDCAIIRLPSLLGLVAAREASASGTPWMAEVVGDAFESLWTHGSRRGKAAAIPMYLLIRHYASRARSTIYVSSTLRRRYPPGGHWVAASNVFIDAPREELLRRRLTRIGNGGHLASATLGLVGSYDVAYKGHETALRALALMQRPDRRVTLRCIGIGDPSRWRVLAERLGLTTLVDLGGPLPHGAAVLEWMDDLDICIVPSLTEGLPRCLIEAMSRALPSVASRTGGIPELLEARWLHRRGDERELARLVDRLLDSPEELAAQARRNWATAANYSATVLEERRDGLVRQFKSSIEDGLVGRSGPARTA